MNLPQKGSRRWKGYQPVTPSPPGNTTPKPATSRRGSGTRGLLLPSKALTNQLPLFDAMNTLPAVQVSAQQRLRPQHRRPDSRRGLLPLDSVSPTPSLEQTLPKPQSPPSLLPAPSTTPETPPRPASAKPSTNEKVETKTMSEHAKAKAKAKAAVHEGRLRDPAYIMPMYRRRKSSEAAERNEVQTRVVVSTVKAEIAAAKARGEAQTMILAQKEAAALRAIEMVAIAQDKVKEEAQAFVARALAGHKKKAGQCAVDEDAPQGIIGTHSSSTEFCVEYGAS